jgi:hypothetical protein
VGADESKGLFIQWPWLATTPTDQAGLDAARHDCAKSGLHEHDGCSCSDEELTRQMEAAFLRSADTFQPDPEMFVCMDSTGCYHVSWNAEEHQAKMSHLRAKHEARYVMVAPDQAGEMEVVARATRFDHQGREQLTLAEVDGRSYALPHGVHDLVTLSQASAAIAARDAEIELMLGKLLDARRDTACAVSRAEAAEAELAKAKEALTPSADTKAEYAGEFYMGVTLRTSREEDYRRVQIPWDSIKEIMAAIRARAFLKGSSNSREKGG